MQNGDAQPQPKPNHVVFDAVCVRLAVAAGDSTAIEVQGNSWYGTPPDQKRYIAPS